ncbi:hypothetical protein ACFL0W_05850 [Nanoarchaeota archaeon]
MNTKKASICLTLDKNEKENENNWKKELKRMEKKELDKILKLSPEERIKMLKAMEEQKKKDIEEAEKLIMESVDQIRREEVSKNIEVPPEKKPNIDKLFGVEEDETTTTATSAQEETKQEFDADYSLEKTVGQDARAAQPPSSGYGAALEQGAQSMYDKINKKPANELYQMASGIAEEVADKGYINSYEEKQLEAIMYAADQKNDAISAGEYKTVSNTVSESLVATQQIGAMLKNRYKGH